MLQVQTEVLPDPAEVGRARRWARSRLLGSGIAPDEPLAETLLLLISELVTNAVVHTGCPAVLRMLFPEPAVADAGTVRVEVADASDRPPAPRHARGDDTGGRGLELVDGLADRWGWQREGAGKHIWCEVDRTSCAAGISADPAASRTAGTACPVGTVGGTVGAVGPANGKGFGSQAPLGSGEGLGASPALGSGDALGSRALGARDRSGYLIATGATGLPTAPTNGSGVALSRKS